MKYSQRETFFWLKDAVRLDRGANAEYREVRRSVEYATQVLIALGGHELSIDELGEGKNKSGLTYDSDVGLSVSVKKSELARIAATGNVPATPAYWDGAVTPFDVRRSLKRKRHPLYEPERISAVAHFLVKFWCGERGVYEMLKHYRDSVSGIVCVSHGALLPVGFNGKSSFIPPLCFFTNEALARFCKLALGHNQTAKIKGLDAGGIRRWVNRLGLKRVARPEIRGLQFSDSKISFLSR